MAALFSFGFTATQRSTGSLEDSDPDISDIGHISSTSKKERQKKGKRKAKETFRQSGVKNGLGLSTMKSRM